MLPPIFAVKKETGYVMYKSHSLSMVDTMRCYKIVPMHVSEMTVRSIGFRNGVDYGVIPGEDIVISRRLYSGESVQYRCKVEASTLAFQVKLAGSHECITAPLISFGGQHSSRIYGNRYARGDISSIWTWNASQVDKEALFKYGRPTDFLTNYTPEGVEKVAIPLPKTEYISVGGCSIPKRVLQGYVESLVAKKETCPITMDELTVETACVSPCYHVMSFEGAQGWVQAHKSCPICRSACLEGDLIRL